MELDEALTQIAEIRQQVARSELFRGFRALPLAFSAFLAFTAAAVQPYWVPEPSQDVAAYLNLWVGTAFLSLLATGIEMAWSMRKSPSALERQQTLLAVSQFLPCLLAGGLLTLVIVRAAPQNAWMLPGLWAVLFGLGILASHRWLPPAIFWVGIFYLGAGTLSVGWAQGEHAFSSWTMALPFGCGQLATAAILYWTLEAHRGSE